MAIERRFFHGWIHKARAFDQKQLFFAQSHLAYSRSATGVQSWRLSFRKVTPFSFLKAPYE